jgi:hypothetical protein
MHEHGIARRLERNIASTTSIAIQALLSDFTISVPSPSPYILPTRIYGQEHQALISCKNWLDISPMKTGLSPGRRPSRINHKNTKAEKEKKKKKHLIAGETPSPWWAIRKFKPRCAAYGYLGRSSVRYMSSLLFVRERCDAKAIASRLRSVARLIYLFSSSRCSRSRTVSVMEKPPNSQSLE